MKPKVSHDYPVVNRTPVARFWYKGQSHTHPVRRTVILIESNPNWIRGYELREGSEVREFHKSPIKTYRRDKIAKISQLDRRRKIRATATSKDLNKSTLNRETLLSLFKNGI